MAESDLSISQMTQGTVNTGTILPGINPDQGSQSGYANYAFTADQMASAFLNFLFPLALGTTNKSVFGAINELAAANGIAVTGTLTAGATTITLSDAAITTDSKFDFYTSIFGVNPLSVTVANGSITLEFEAQAVNMTVEVEVR